MELQPFVELYSAGGANVSVNGEDQNAGLFTYSPSGSFTETLVPIANFGCEAVNSYHLSYLQKTQAYKRNRQITHLRSLAA